MTARFSVRYPIACIFLIVTICHGSKLIGASSRLAKATVRLPAAVTGGLETAAWFRKQYPDADVVATWDDAVDGLSTTIFDVILPGSQLHLLKASTRFVVESVAPGGPFRTAQQQSGSAARRPAAAAADDYHAPEEIFAALHKLEQAHPELAMMQNLTALYNLPLTIDGNSLHAFKVSANVREDDDEPNMLLVSNHHSRELVTPELALDAAVQLVNGYVAGDEDARAVMDAAQVYIMWTMNPDGLAHVWDEDRYWRKNRRPNPDGRSVGVDLNRNYAVGWDFSCSGSTSQPSQTYRGQSSVSEVETRAMTAFAKDRQFSHVMDFHSFAREVRINYGTCAKLPKAIDELFQKRAAEIANLLDYRQARSCCMGGQIHNAYHEHGSLAFLTETATAFQPPRADMRKEVVRVRPGTMKFFQIPIPVVGHVAAVPGPTQGGIREALSGATLSVSELKFELEEKPGTSNSHGRYHLWIPEGTWSVTAAKAGFQPVTQRVTVRDGHTSTLDFDLEPAL